MMIIFLSIILPTFVISSFSFTYKCMGLNRCIINSPIQIVEASIFPITYAEDETLYIDKSTFKSKYKKYLDSQVYRYVNDYTVSYYFYTSDNKQACTLKDCMGVEISFNARIDYIYPFHRTIYFELKGVFNG